MSREDVQTNLRLPADLKDRLTASALSHGRSLSAEVAHRLQKSYEPVSIADQAQALMEMATQTRLQIEMLRVEGKLNQVTHRGDLLAAQLDSSKAPRDAAARQEFADKVEALRSERAQLEEELAAILVKLGQDGGAK